MSLLRGGNILSEWFVAKITAVGTASAPPDDGVPHAWVMLYPSDNLSRMVDNEYAPRTIGTLEDSPAFALDGSQSTVGTVVMMRRRGASPIHNNAMEFIKTEGGGGGGGGVDSVQCTGGELVVVYA